MELEIVAVGGGCDPETAQIIFHNYGKNFALPQMSDVDTVIARIRSDTLMGSTNTVLGQRDVSLTLLSPQPRNIRRIGHNSRLEDELLGQQRALKRIRHGFSSGASVDLLLWAAPEDFVSTGLQTYCGPIPLVLPDRGLRSRLLAPLTSQLGATVRKYFGVALEIAAPAGSIDYDLNHSAVPDGRYATLMDPIVSWIKAVSTTVQIQTLLGIVQDLQQAEVATRLQQRQEDIQKGRFVFVENELVLQEPKSEKDVLALYFKMEGAGSLPLAMCRVLEHTPARDTDAVGHFQIDAGDVPKRFALIEFEFKFATFITHGHSLRHVDLVVCWSTSRGDPLHSTDRPWLATFSDPHLGKSVPVIILNKIPELEVRHA